MTFSRALWQSASLPASKRPGLQSISASEDSHADDPRLTGGTRLEADTLSVGARDDDNGALLDRPPADDFDLNKPQSKPEVDLLLS